MDYCDEILQSDCVEILPRISSDSADIIIADPPYNIGKNFGVCRDRLPVEDYIAWSEKWLGDCMRILKPAGTMFIYGFPELLAHLSVRLPLRKHRWLQWHYTNKNMPRVNFWQRSHESILCVWKEKPIFNRDVVREPYSEFFLQGSAGRKRAAGPGRLSKGKGPETIYTAHKNGALPRDVICIPSLAGGAALRERIIFCKTCQSLVAPQKRREHEGHRLIIHPTQKPRALTRRLILSCKPKGDFTILVPFCGSGSECAEAKSLGGNFITCELNMEYIILAQAVIGQV